MPVQNLIQIRRGSASQWTSTNPTLSAGEWGLETDTGRYKVGDGITTWTSLKYSSILPNSNDFVVSSGLGVTFGTNGIPVTVSVSGLTTSQLTDFNSAVSAIVASGTLGTEQVMDIVGSGLVAGSGISTSYNGTSQLTISVSGLSSSYISDFNSAVTGLVPVTSIVGGSGISVANTGTVYTVSLSDPTIQSTDVTDFVDAVNDRVADLLTAGSNIGLTYTDSGNDNSTLQISVTGVALSGHTHVLSNITDVTSSATELNYLDGSVPGTGVASKAVVLDSNSSITGINAITTSGNIIVGGNLTVNGTTTTVNSNTVNIGDNIIVLNSDETGSPSQDAGIEIERGTDTNVSLLWDETLDRWTVGTGVFVAGTFIGNLTGTASNVTTNANLTGDVTSVGNSTSIASGVIVNSDINDSAAIAYSKLNLSSSIVNTDIASNANIAVTKLASGSTGQVLQVSASGIVWGGIDGGTP